MNFRIINHDPRRRRGNINPLPVVRRRQTLPRREHHRRARRTQGDQFTIDLQCVVRRKTHLRTRHQDQAGAIGDHQVGVDHIGIIGWTRGPDRVLRDRATLVAWNGIDVINTLYIGWTAFCRTVPYRRIEGIRAIGQNSLERELACGIRHDTVLPHTIDIQAHFRIRDCRPGNSLWIVAGRRADSIEYGCCGTCDNRWQRDQSVDRLAEHHEVPRVEVPVGRVQGGHITDQGLVTRRGQGAGNEFLENEQIGRIQLAIRTAAWRKITRHERRGSRYREGAHEQEGQQSAGKRPVSTGLQSPAGTASLLFLWFCWHQHPPWETGRGTTLSHSGDRHARHAECGLERQHAGHTVLFLFAEFMAYSGSERKRNVRIRVRYVPWCIRLHQICPFILPVLNSRQQARTGGWMCPDRQVRTIVTRYSGQQQV